VPAKPKVYLESSCFIEIAKHTVGTDDQSREQDVWILKRLLMACKNQHIEIYTSMLSVAECQSAKPILDDRVKGIFKALLTSGQYVMLVQDTILIAERARNLRWVHDINCAGPDALHIGSAMEMECEELLSFDRGILKIAPELEKLGLNVRIPRDTLVLPARYRQEKLDLGVTEEI
jgi:hypothetical protein